MTDPTHEVLNQSAPLVDYNLFLGNQALRDALAFHAPGLEASALSASNSLSALGATLGSAEMQQHARLANVHRPQLHTHDRVGHRVDQVEFHPSYHELMRLAVRHGLHATPWSGGLTHVERAAAFMLFTELEPSVLCPISMTYSVMPALHANPAISAEWSAPLASHEYDPRFAPAGQKTGLTMGMGMTEKQGGSDVRANTTRARFDADTPWGRRYRLVGHKWFFSAPMCDAHLVLAQTESGLSCFFLPRWLPDGDVNAIRIQRLKDKLGNHANASAEVEFHDAQAWLVGDDGRGVRQILEMGALTRLDCALGTSGLMRQALAQALNHAAQRRAFGRLLIEQPLMKNVLADLALECEAAVALALRLARTIDGGDDPHESALRRALTPIAKFWICKRGAAFAQEAMECLGGNGYVEEGGEGVMARIYREMPLNSIWEGAGNIMALDLLRALRQDSTGAALDAELATARGADRRFDALAESLPERIDTTVDESSARILAQDIALLLQAALLQRHAPGFVFEAFCRARLEPDRGLAFGMLPAGVDLDALIERARPR